ncbi:hypothetical protein HDV05_004427 [Chytridiales sp. JEL 0842]|nr:hypothetical protein HDV05_004427 [Chytridiales sp. JEL 0842]
MTLDYWVRGSTPVPPKTPSLTSSSSDPEPDDQNSDTGLFLQSKQMGNNVIPGTSSSNAATTTTLNYIDDPKAMEAANLEADDDNSEPSFKNVNIMTNDNIKSPKPRRFFGKTQKLARRFTRSTFWLKTRKCLTCCIPRNRTARFICLGATLAVLIAVIVVGYLYWPRFPSTTVNELKFNQALGGFVFDKPKDAATWNELTLTINLILNISAYNWNRYPLNIETMQLQAFLKVNETAVNTSPSPVALNIQNIVGPTPILTDRSYKGNFYPLIGQGVAKDLMLPAWTNTTFTLPFTITYKPDPLLGLLRDPVFAEFMNVCGVTSRRRKARIEYKAISTVTNLKGLGYTPVLEGFINMECPASEEQIEAVTNNVRVAVETGGDSFEALEKVFEGDDAFDLKNITSIDGKNMLWKWQ